MISGGRISSKSDGSFAALKARLAQGKGKASPISTGARGNKTSWSKNSKARMTKSNTGFATSGATPGVKPTGNKA